MLECAPKHFRGGNSRHTRNLRCMHDAPADVLTDAYPEEEYWQDLLKVTGGRDQRAARADDDPARGDVPQLDGRARRALSTVARRHAARLAHERVLPGRRQGADQRLLPRGGGARRARCATTREVTRLDHRDGRIRFGASLRAHGAEHEIRARTVVAAAGGFESNSQWLEGGWGPVGRQLHRPRHALQHGARAAAPARQRRQVRSATRRRGTAWRSTRARRSSTAGICTRVDCVSLGIVVNERGERFYDEGEDFWPKRYAIWGRLVARPAGPDRLLDHRREGDGQVHAAGVPGDRRRRRSRELARRARLDPRTRSTATVARFNAAVPPGTLRPHDARRLRDGRADAAEDALGAADRHAAVLRVIRCGPGITFTYLGRHGERAGAGDLRRTARQRPTCSRPGEIMAGNVLGQGISGGHRHVDRHGVRPRRGRGGRAPCRSASDDPRGAASSRRASAMAEPSATPAATARASARSSRRSSDARIRRGRCRLSRQPLPQLRVLLLRVPVRAAARIRSSMCRRMMAEIRARELSRSMHGPERSRGSSSATDSSVSLATRGGSRALPAWRWSCRRPWRFFAAHARWRRFVLRAVSAPR